MKRYVVDVERVLRLRTRLCFVDGPFPFLWMARTVAWLRRAGGSNVWQTAIVRRIK